MKRNLLLLTTLLFVHFISNAQDFPDAGKYIDYITNANDELTKKYLAYLSAMSHSTRAKKIEKKRMEVVNAISDTRFKIAGMPPYKGDRTFRDTSVAYFKILNSVFNEDYGKIVNMEEIAEQSYDAMEAYLLAQEKASEKLEQAAEKQHETLKKFAAAQNVTLVEGETTTSAKMKLANQVQDHYHEIYLIFFKAYKQEAYMVEAQNQKKLVAVEQNMNSLKNYSEEGLEKLKGKKGYNNDPSLIIACREAMNFYKDEVNKGATITDLMLKEENFEKIKKAYDSKSANKRTQQDVDAYNKAVNEMNDAVNKFNKTNNEVNKGRAAMLDKWNKAVSTYMDSYVPYEK